MQPVPALVMACRYTWSCTSPAANTPGTLVIVDERQSPPVSLVFNRDRSEQRVSPASTFKIPHTLFALDAGVVAEADWSSVKDSGASPLEALVERGRLGEGALLEALGRASSVPPVDLSRAHPDKAALEALSQETCLEFGVLPLSKNGEVLTVAIGDPFAVLLLDDLRRRCGCHVRHVLSHPLAIKRAQEKAFQTGAKQVESLLDEVGGKGADVEVAVEDQPDDIEASIGAGDDAPAVKLVNVILQSIVTFTKESLKQEKRTAKIVRRVGEKYSS